MLVVSLKICNVHILLLMILRLATTKVQISLVGMKRLLSEADRNFLLSVIAGSEKWERPDTALNPSRD